MSEFIQKTVLFRARIWTYIVMTMGVFGVVCVRALEALDVPCPNQRPIGRLSVRVFRDVFPPLLTLFAPLEVLSHLFVCFCLLFRWRIPSTASCTENNNECRDGLAFRAHYQLEILADGEGWCIARTRWRLAYALVIEYIFWCCGGSRRRYQFHWYYDLWFPFCVHFSFDHAPYFHLVIWISVELWIFLTTFFYCDDAPFFFYCIIRFEWELLPWWDLSLLAMVKLAHWVIGIFLLSFEMGDIARSMLPSVICVSFG